VQAIDRRIGVFSATKQARVSNRAGLRFWCRLVAHGGTWSATKKRHGKEIFSPYSHAGLRYICTIAGKKI